MIDHIQFQNIDNVIMCGDVHGEWDTLSYNIKERYKIENGIIIQLGDFGIGFHVEEYNKIHLKKLNLQLKKNKNHLVVLRGNHDDPKYFDGKYSKSHCKSYSNIHLIPDYTVVGVDYNRDVPDDGIQNTTGHLNILCIGGGLSIDRTYRKEWELRNYPKRSYWEDEMVVFDAHKLNEINEEYPHDIQILCSHTAPSWAYPTDKGQMLLDWMAKDPKLKEDDMVERSTMNEIHERLLPEQIVLCNWYYAHFHQYKREHILRPYNRQLSTNMAMTLLDIHQIFEHRLV